MKYILDLRYVKLLAYKMARKIQVDRGESHKHRYTYYVGVQFILGLINEILLLLATSAILGISKETMIVALVFTSIRIFAGGLHLNSYTQCCYVSLLILLLCGFIAHNLPFNMIVHIVVFMFTFINILKFTSSLKYKRISLICLSFWFILNILIGTFAITCGMLISGVILLPVFNLKNVKIV